MMKKKYVYFIGILLLVLTFFNSCELYNPSEPVPCYIHIDKIDLATNPVGFATPDGSEGSLSQKITDAWVYVDEQLIGCFQLPATFPVLFSGKHNVKIRPGIKINGIAATRSPYPFYGNYSVDVDFKPNTRVTLSPTVQYNANTHFAWIEDFESPGVTIDTLTGVGSDTNMTKIYTPNPNVFEGGASGALYLDNGIHTFVECVSNTSFILPKAGSSVFLEMNYKSNIYFSIGMYAHSPGSTNVEMTLGINPSPEWNKIYIYLTPTIGHYSAATDYSIYITTANTVPLDSVAVLLDNIKLVY